MTKASASASRPAPLTSTDPAPAKPKRSSRKRAPAVPDVPGRARIIAIANQKGGVGKSTTAVSLGAALADIGYRVLVADLDPQGNASTGMGIRHDARDVTVYDVVVAEADIQRAIIPTPVDRLHAVPATIDLAGAEIELVSQFSRESRLKRAIEPIAEGVYDFILLDCPPSLGLLTINALTAAEELIVPIQCEYYALEGLGQLLRNVSLVQQNINSGLRLSGIVMTMFDPRTKLSEQVVQEVQRYFGDLVYGVIIPRTVRLSEAPGFGQPITVYDAKSKGAEAYRQLAREVALRPPPDTPMPSFEDISVPVMGAGEDVVTVDEAGEGNGSRAREPAPEAEVPVERGNGKGSSADARRRPSAAKAEPEVDPRRTEVEAEVEVGSVVEAEGQPEIEHELPSSPRATDASGTEVQLEDLWEDPPPEPEPRVKPLSRPPPPGELPERRVVVIDESSEFEATSPEGSVGSPEPRGDDRTGMADIGSTLDDEKGRKRRWRVFRKGGDR